MNLRETMHLISDWPRVGYGIIYLHVFCLLAFKYFRNMLMMSRLWIKYCCNTERRWIFPDSSQMLQCSFCLCRFIIIMDLFWLDTPQSMPPSQASCLIWLIPPTPKDPRSTYDSLCLLSQKATLWKILHMPEDSFSYFSCADKPTVTHIEKWMWIIFLPLYIRLVIGMEHKVLSSLLGDNM